MQYYSHDEQGHLLGEYPGDAQIVSWTKGSNQSGLYFKYTGPENGLEKAFETYWNATSDGSCGVLDATVYTGINFLTWQWTGCASADSSTYTTLSNTGKERIKES